jgi:hypothetical protein
VVNTPHFYEFYLNSKSKKEEPIMHKISTPVKSQRVADTSRFTKRIGSTEYKVGVYFKQDAKETLEDKIFRIIEREVCRNVTA